MTALLAVGWAAYTASELAGRAGLGVGLWRGPGIRRPRGLVGLLDRPGAHLAVPSAQLLRQQQLRVEQQRLITELRAGADPTTEDDLMAILEAECRQGKTVLASTHDLAGVAEHFTRLLSLNRTVVADRPAALVRDTGVLRATYGGHLIEVDHGDLVLLDDPQHGDVAR